MNNLIDFLNKNPLASFYIGMIIGAVVTYAVLSSWFKIDKSQKIGAGCLYGKTIVEKTEFFNKLYTFSKTDIVFFCEQYDDLQQLEKYEFQSWLVNVKCVTENPENK